MLETSEAASVALPLCADPATAASTPVGLPNLVDTTGIDVNDDGIGYAIGYWEFEDGDGIQTRDLARRREHRHARCTGADRARRCLSSPSSTNARASRSDRPHEVVIACTSTVGDNFSYVGLVDPVTGILTPDITRFDEGYVEYTALAYDAVTGVLWGFGVTDGWASYTLDLPDNDVDFVTETDPEIWGADFDRDGQLSITTYGDFPDAEGTYPILGTMDPEVGDVTEVGPYIDTATNTALVEVEAITVWGKPALSDDRSRGCASPRARDGAAAARGCRVHPRPTASRGALASSSGELLKTDTVSRPPFY